jgi:acyl-coenzyme A synthetase/AMP-(fatty) acid ligase
VLADHLARRPPGEAALSPDGVTWLSARDLLRNDAPARDVAPVPAADPVDAVRGIVAAQQAGAVPLVLPPGTAAPDVPARPGLLALATSGTTSRPRIVLRTAASWDAALDPFSDVTGQRPDDVAWAPGPASSTLTLWAIHHALATGTPVIATGRWRGVPVGRDAVTVVHTVPPVLADVLAARQAGRLPRLRLAVVAGAAVPAAVRARAETLGVRVVEYYGAAELSFVAVDPDGGGLRPFPGVEVRTRGGVIEVRSPYVALGYADGDGPLCVVDGWAGVGDRGRLGPDGVLVVEGRGTDALSVGGATVLVGDVERVLGGVPGVLEIACVGEPDAVLGERAAAVVRPAPGVEAARLVRELRAVARRELPPAARPVRYVVAAALPRTPGGKADRAGLRRVLAGPAGRPA